MARMFPLEATSKAVESGISFIKAAIKATSEEKGKIVAAKKAEKKSAVSAMFSQDESRKYFESQKLSEYL